MSDQDFAPASRRIGGFLFVVLLHAGILYALVSGLGRQMVEVIRSPLETRIVDEAKPPPPPPPPPIAPPKLAAPPPTFVPLPEVKVQTPPPANAITAVTTVKPAEPVPVLRAPPPVAPPAPVAEPVRVAPVIDAAHSCKRPEYPSMSRRLEESGVVMLQFLIDVDGKVIDSKIEKSSGYERLDNAARDALQLCRFKPGTVDGKPEQGWAKLRYEWKLD